MTEFVCENINTLDVDIDDRCFSEIADEMYYSDKSNIAVVGASASENTNLVLSFIKKYSQNYNHVFYMVYDKDKYVFYPRFLCVHV